MCHLSHFLSFSHSVCMCCCIFGKVEFSNQRFNDQVEQRLAFAAHGKLAVNVKPNVFSFKKKKTLTSETHPLFIRQMSLWADEEIDRQSLRLMMCSFRMKWIMLYATVRAYLRARVSTTTQPSSSPQRCRCYTNKEHNCGALEMIVQCG